MVAFKDIQKHRIKTHFESDLTDYDYCAECVVPRNLELQQEMVNAIPLKRIEPLKMLDLGVGTGQTTSMVFSEFTNAKIHAIDISAAMLQVAKKRLSKHGNSVSLEEGDFCEIDFAGPYEVVFSAVTIHNCLDAQKKKLFKKIYGALSQNGVFVNADFIRFSNLELERKARSRYFEYLTGRLSGDSLAHWLRHAREEDKPASLEHQFSWLKRAGFRNMACTWLYQNMAVYSAFKT